jgi:hypothetical protein
VLADYLRLADDGALSDTISVARTHRFGTERGKIPTRTLGDHRRASHGRDTDRFGVALLGTTGISSTIRLLPAASRRL